MISRCAYAFVLHATFMGCADKAIECFPVHGQVMQGEKSIADASVILHPIDGQPSLRQKPLAFTDDQGRFAITTVERGDGAPSGEYKVTVQLKALKQVGEEMVRDGVDLLPLRFRDPATSELRHSVRSEPSELLISLPAK